MLTRRTLLVGETIDNIKLTKSSFITDNYYIDLTRRLIKSEVTIATRSSEALTVRIEQIPLSNDHKSNKKRAFIIVQDLTANLWINKQLEKGKVILGGIIDKHLHIRFLRDMMTSLLLEPDHSPNDISLLQFLAEHERQHVLSIMEAISNTTQEQNITLHTSKLSGVQLELELTITPILNGYNQSNEFAFVIWDLRPIDAETDSAMKLKIWMAKRDISTGQLSIATGISQQTISKLRNGKIEKPQRLTAELIASELQVDVHDIWPVIRK